MDKLAEFLPGKVSVIDKDKLNGSIALSQYDLIVFSGGSDVPTVMRHPEEYFQEIEIIKNVKIPILGICLGAEIINIAFDGTIKKLGKEFLGNYSIDIKDGSAKKVLGDAIIVAEGHSMAVDILGDRLEIIADSNRGIEIMKHRTKSIIGLQFHPELTSNKKLADWIFDTILRKG